MNRTLLLFEESIKSPITKKNYTKHLDKFFIFSKLNSYDELISMDLSKLQILIEDYVIYLKKIMNPNSMPTYMTGIKHYFIMNRINIFWEIIQKMYPARVKSAGQKAWSDENVAKMLEYEKTKRNKAIIHFMASTGTRIGVHSYPLQIQHLKDVGDGVKAVLIYADESDEYWSFLTPEASNYLDDYLEQRKREGEKFDDNTPLFRAKYSMASSPARQVGRNAVISMIYRVINKAGLERKRINKNFDIQMDHGFRKRFNIILKLDNNINSNLAEKIMGHSSTIKLDNAYLPSTDPRVFEQCVVEFKKAVLELTIDKSAKADLEINCLKSEKTELQKVNAQLKEIAKERDEMAKQSQNQLVNYDGDPKLWEERIRKVILGLNSNIT